MILAAGQGTRLRPFTVNRPKGMIPVGNRPIIEHVVDSLVANGVRDIVLVVGYCKEQVMSHFGDGRDIGARIEYAVQERQIGTASALMTAAHLLDGNFLVLPGDNLVDSTSVGEVMSCQGNAMLVTLSDEPSKYGVVTVKEDMVSAIHEKPLEDLGSVINTGVYQLSADLLPQIATNLRNGLTALTDNLNAMLPDLRMEAINCRGLWLDAVYPWDLLDLNAALVSQGQERNGTIESGVTIKGDVSIGRGSRIRAGTYIQGPVQIGEGCDIGPDVTVLPATSIGDGVRVEPYTMIAQSIIMDNAQVCSHTHLSYCVIGDGVDLGPHTSAPSGEAVGRVDSELFDLRKVGAMIGAHSHLGANVTLAPGVLIGVHCEVSAGTRVDRNIKDSSVVI